MLVLISIPPFYFIRSSIHCTGRTWFIVKKSQEGTKDCLREPPNMLQVSLLIRYPNHKFSNYNLTDLNKIILIVRYVIDVNFGYLCLYSTNE